MIVDLKYRLPYDISINTQQEKSMTTFDTCNFEEFKQRSSEFFKLAKTSSPDQIETGFKALTLSYIALEGDEQELHEASLLIQIAGRKTDPDR